MQFIFQSENTSRKTSLNTDFVLREPLSIFHKFKMNLQKALVTIEGDNVLSSHLIYISFTIE